MIAIISSTAISISLLILYILFILSYKKLVFNRILREEAELKEQHIIKFVSEEKREEVREKLDKISQIITETKEEIEKTVRKKIEVAEAQTKLTSSEEDIIDNAGKEYRVFTAGLKSAMPKTEEELKNDINDLEDTIKKLESLDESHYKDETERVNIGVGMFYEKMSRRFLSIIKNNDFDDFPFIPSQRLIFHVYSEVKNLKENDFFPIFKLMQKTSLIKDLVEINPSFYILGFEEKLDISYPEKVVFNAIYDHKNLTIHQLLELAEWDFTYADKIINKMKKKGFLFVENDIIKTPSFSSFKERKKWNDLIEERKKEQTEKEEEKLRRKLQRQAKLKSKLKEVKEEKEKKIEKKDFKEKAEELEVKPLKVKFGKKPSVKSLPGEKKQEVSLKLPLDFDVEKEELDLKEIISQKILSFHEKFSLLNGGFSQYEKIKDYLLKELDEISDEVLKPVLEQLIELKLISTSLKIGKSTFYLFKYINFSKDEINFMKYAMNKKPLQKDVFRKGLKWSEERILKSMKTLQEKGILRIESDKIIIPGIQQT